MRDRLIELLLDHTDNAFKTSEEKHFIESTTIGEVADTILADGWMRPPCKVGDKLYFLYGSKVFNLTVEKIVIKEEGMFLVDKAFNDWYSIEELGKTLYLSEEEAEAKLKEGGKE